MCSSAVSFSSWSWSWPSWSSSACIPSVSSSGRALSPQGLQQVQGLQVGVHRLFQGAGHPAVRLAPHIQEQVTGGQVQQVGGRGLVAVEIHPGVLEPDQLHAGQVSHHLPGPVIDREDGGHHPQGFFLPGSASGRGAGGAGRAAGAAGQDCSPQAKGHQGGQDAEFLSHDNLRDREITPCSEFATCLRNDYTQLTTPLSTTFYRKVLLFTLYHPPLRLTLHLQPTKGMRKPKEGGALLQ